MSKFPLAALALAAAGIPGGAVPAAAQVYTDLGPIKLEYRILLEDEPIPIGTAEIAFAPIETKRGPRLQIESSIEYVVPWATPVEYYEESTLVCDDRGTVTFETVARAEGSERKNTALRMGDDYHVTTTFDGKTHQKTITAGVTRTNFGLFCGGFLEKPLNRGAIIEDFPLLFPVGADHQPRHKFREATVNLRLVPHQKKVVTVIVTTLRRKDQKADRYWNTNDRYQMLVRMEENTNYGVMTYELIAINGVPPIDSDLIG